MKKCIFSLWLVFALCLSFMPMSAFAADTIEVDKVEISGIVAPVAGEVPCLDVEIKLSSNGAPVAPEDFFRDTSDFVSWYWALNHETYPDGSISYFGIIVDYSRGDPNFEKFHPGEAYMIDIRGDLNAGCTLADDAEIFVNGVKIDKTSLNFVYGQMEGVGDWVLGYQNIYQIPGESDIPYYPVTFAESGHIKSAYTEWEGRGNRVPAGYAVHLYAVPEEGYELDHWEIESESGNSRINDYGGYWFSMPDKAVVLKPFARAAETVVTVTGTDTLPKVGENFPIYRTLTAGDSARYTVTGYGEIFTCDLATYLDFRNDPDMNDTKDIDFYDRYWCYDVKAEAGRTYLLYYSVDAKDGYVFSDATTVEINGMKAYIMPVEEGASAKTLECYLELTYGEEDIIEPVAYDLWVDGIQVTSVNKDDILRNGTASYDPDKGELTLNDAVLTKVHDGSLVSAAVYAEDDLTVILKGDNTVSLASSVDGSGFYAASEAKLTLTGNGNLDITIENSDGKGLYVNAYGDLILNQAGSLTIDTVGAGIYTSDYSDITISGSGDVSITAGDDGFYTSGSIILSGSGKVTVESDGEAANFWNNSNSKLLLNGTGSPISLTAGSGHKAVLNFEGESPVAGTNIENYDVTGAPDTASVVYTLKAGAPIPITEVHVTGMPTELIVGASTAISADDVTIATVPADAADVVEICWWNESVGAADDTTFNADDAYCLGVHLAPKDGYYFEFENNDWENYTGEATFNDEPARAAWSYATGSADLFMGSKFIATTAPAPVEITEIVITDADITPVLGEKAGDHLAYTLPAGCHYTATMNGWWDIINSRIMTADDVFEDGGLYCASWNFVADEGYAFAANATITINGSAENVDTEHSYLDASGEEPLFIISAKGVLVEAQQPAPTYTMIAGMDGEWTKGSTTGLSFTSDAPFAKFDSVQVDGNTIAATDYTAEEGSTKITLAPAYLETLSVGSHSIEIISNDGSASTNFTVKAAEPTEPTDPTEPTEPTDPTDPTDPTEPTDPVNPTDPTSPQTGDSSHLFLWSALLLVSSGALVGTAVYGKKRKRAE